MIEETINGFTVIAEKADRYDQRTILGHRPATWGHEYVVGHHVAPDRKSWSRGTYTHDLAHAVEVFTEA